ncbi:MAG: sialidase family protein [Bacteroidota bacterium]|nr:sialidase family protein [Bacteroidota bacterium]
MAFFLNTGINAQNTGLRVLSQEFIFSDAPFSQCHASTLAEMNNGDILAAWFGGSFEGAKDVCIWGSLQHDGKWLSPFRIVCGKTVEDSVTPCWNPVLFRANDSTIFLYYKQGVSPREWQGRMVLSHDNGKTWTGPVILRGYAGPVKNKPLITRKGTWLNPASKESASRWQVFIERSADQGKTWNIIPIDTMDPAKVIQPCLLSYPNGKIQALCRSNQNYIMESWSIDDGITWSNLQKTDLPNPNSGIDAITLDSGLQLLVFNPQNSGKDWWDGRNKLSIAISADGQTWKEICKLEDQDRGEFSYPAVIQTKDGTIHITYTYNRTQIKHITLEVK